MAAAGLLGRRSVFPPRQFFTPKRIFILSSPFIAIAVAIFFFSPVVSASVPGPCLGCEIHYTETPSCALLGPTGFGLTDWQGQRTIGCWPPDVP